MNHSLMYDERKQAEEIVKNGFEHGSYNWKEALLVAKYYRQVLGYGDARVKTEITKFCESNDSYFHPVPKRKTIKGLVKRSTQTLYDYTSPIDIRQAELDQIRNIKKFKFQQITLGILAITKRNFIYNNGYLNIYFWKDVKRVVNFRRTTNVEIERCFTFLNDLEMACPTRNTTAHKILFVDDTSPVFFHITTDTELKQLGETYKGYCGGELIWCRGCGKETIKKSNRKFLCNDCWKEKRSEKILEYVRKHRSKGM
jgi:hypothetical protein